MQYAPYIITWPLPDSCNQNKTTSIRLTQPLPDQATSTRCMQPLEDSSNLYQTHATSPRLTQHLPDACNCNLYQNHSASNQTHTTSTRLINLSQTHGFWFLMFFCIWFLWQFGFRINLLLLPVLVPIVRI